VETEQITLAKAETLSMVVDTSTRLAVERTRVAYDRTMMAWIRTASSLITFGFAVYKFIDIDQRRLHTEFDGPRIFGIAMVSFGLISLLLATIENRRDMRQLNLEGGDQRRPLARTLALLIAVLGILALVIMLLRS